MAMLQCMIQRKGERECSFENYYRAARRLSGSAFKLYIYLEGFVISVFNYSRIAAHKELGLNHQTLNGAFAELCEHNYLQKINEGVYNFLSTPV